MFVCDWLMRTVVPKSFDTPYRHIDGYMNRYHVVPIKAKLGGGCGPVTWRRPFAKLMQFLNISCRVHEILRSDDDRVHHDHPFNFCSVVLRGGYTEHRPLYDKSGLYVGNSTEWISPGRVVFRRYNCYHRLELPSGQTAWTLFFTGRYLQKWGFLIHPRHKVPYTDYTQMRTPNSQQGE